MVDEVTYQRYIVKSVKESGGYALKMSNAFLVGVPDLLLKMKHWPTPQVWEAKKVEVDWMKTMRPLRIETTPLQRKTLREMRQAGVSVAILMVLPGPGRAVTLALTRDIEQTHLQPEEFKACHHLRKISEPWSASVSILNHLVPQAPPHLMVLPSP